MRRTSCSPVRGHRTALDVGRTECRIHLVGSRSSCTNPCGDHMVHGVRHDGGDGFALPLGVSADCSRAVGREPKHDSARVTLSVGDVGSATLGHWSLSFGAGESAERGTAYPGVAGASADQGGARTSAARRSPSPSSPHRSFRGTAPPHSTLCIAGVPASSGRVHKNEPAPVSTSTAHPLVAPVPAELVSKGRGGAPMVCVD